MTQTDKKGREHKTKLIEEIREFVDDVKYVFVISHKNIDSTNMKNVRELVKSAGDDKKNPRPVGRIINGKNRIMQIGLGREEDDSHLPGLYNLSQHLTGECMLFSTNSGPKAVSSFFNAWSRDVSPREGSIAVEDVVVPAGYLDKYAFPAPMDTRLRSLGLPCQRTVAGKGDMKGDDINNDENVVIEVLDEHTICTEGQKLSAKQAKLLTHFGHKFEKMGFKTVAYWSAKTGKITQL